MIPSIEDIEAQFINTLEKVKSISTSNLIEKLTIHFDLTDAQKSCLTACGRQFKFNNRVIYVRTKLRREGIIQIDKNKNITLS